MGKNSTLIIIDDGRRIPQKLSKAHRPKGNSQPYNNDGRQDDSFRLSTQRMDWKKSTRRQRQENPGPIEKEGKRGEYNN
jgi:hypothetical protein